MLLLASCVDLLANIGSRSSPDTLLTLLTSHRWSDRSKRSGCLTAYDTAPDPALALVSVAHLRRGLGAAYWSAVKAVPDVHQSIRPRCLSSSGLLNLVIQR